VPIQPPPSPRSQYVSQPPPGERTSPGTPLALAAVAPPVPGYAVLFIDSSSEAIEKAGRSGLSHAEAMADAEELQREGKTARVMHVLGAKSYEVDRYPPR
jgi:hypothetical protein